jgi:hypothetical protein
MTVTNRQKKNCSILKKKLRVSRQYTTEGQKGRWKCHVEAAIADKNKATTNRNLSQGKGNDTERTVTSYFDPVWNAFSNHTDGSIQWTAKQIVAIGEDFHRQVGDGKVRTTLYKVRWEGYDKKDDTWKPISSSSAFYWHSKQISERPAGQLLLPILALPPMS